MVSDLQAETWPAGFSFQPWGQNPSHRLLMEPELNRLLSSREMPVVTEIIEGGVTRMGFGTLLSHRAAPSRSAHFRS